ncbi:MAG TPA: hypothetical protein VEN81_09295 [Planctomycetota bacterium]|nr:hypothetical protein [Planctomycetota bacterium]
MAPIVHSLWVATLLALFLTGCQGEPAPQGYHYQMVNNGKRSEQMMVADVDSTQADRLARVMVRSASDQPGPGDYYVFVTEGKRTSHILVHDEDLKGGGPGLRIEVSPDQLCPHCTVATMTIGKRVERRYYCDPSVHVLPNSSRTGVSGQ